MNQACTHLPRQMDLKTHAGDLDLFDRRLPRRRLRPRVAFANQLPVNPAGKLCQQKVIWSALAQRSGDSALDWLFVPIRDSLLITKNPKRRRRFAQPAHSKPQKEDQCQES